MSEKGKTRFGELAVSALLSESTIEAAAEKAGISKTHPAPRLQDDNFRDAYNRAKADALRTATAMLTRNSGKASTVLQEIFSGKPEPRQGARTAAAIGTLRLALEAFELENLEERIRRLEGQSDAL